MQAQCPNLVWSDEFSGTSLDLTKWNYQTGDGCAEGICGWGNNELQTYRQENVEVSDGVLKIIAKAENVDGKNYTSGRITTRNKGDFTYGRFEASIKLPAANGLWPAFWTLSTNEPYGGWPQSGEIDIMEFVANKPEEILGTIHYGNPFPQNQFKSTYYTIQEGEFPDDYHDFAVEWEEGEIRWFIDDVLYAVKNPGDLGPFRWPFDQDMYLILNVAVGGNLGGTVFSNLLPDAMEVDYVRVYDGFKPYLEGVQSVENRAENVSFKVSQLSADVAVNWTVPDGATIVNGQGTNQLIVSFGDQSGEVTATFNDGCQDRSISNYVKVAPPFARTFSFENFDDQGTATLNFLTGTLSEVSNPAPDEVNNSSIVGQYVRNSAEQYDRIIYDVSGFGSAANYLDGSKKIYLDVYTSAPVGTEILLQLETANSENNDYPVGRHSRWVAKVEENNSWHRLVFSLLDRPDQSASNFAISKLVLLFDSDSNSGGTYYFDNLDSYSPMAVTSNERIKVSQEIQIFPNPAEDEINFKLPENNTIDFVEIFTLNGQRVLRQRIQASQYNLNIGHLEKGTYLFKATDMDGKVFVQKLIK